MFVRYQHEECSLEKAFVNRKRHGNEAGNGPPVGGTPTTRFASPLLYKFAYLSQEQIGKQSVKQTQTRIHISVLYYSFTKKAYYHGFLRPHLSSTCFWCFWHYWMGRGPRSAAISY